MAFSKQDPVWGGGTVCNFWYSGESVSKASLGYTLKPALKKKKKSSIIKISCHSLPRVLVVIWDHR